LGVDGDLAHVVDDHRDSQDSVVGEDMVQERGLTDPEKAGEHGHGQTMGVALTGIAFRSFGGA
jgi:hypothetical protein